MDDLREHLDAAIGAGPDHRPVASLLTAGHRAVRRRRIAAVTGTAVVLAVVGTTYAAAGGQPRAAHDPQVTHPGPTASATPDPSPAEDAAAEQPWGRYDFIRYDDRNGRLEVRSGVQILDRVDDYLRGTRFDHSVAMDVLFEGKEYWVSAEWVAATKTMESYGSAGMTKPSDGWADFRAWTDDQAAANGVEVEGGSGYPDLVVAAADATLSAAPGARILEQTATDLPEGFDRAAYVGRDGRRYLVLERIIGSQEPELITVHAEPHGDSLDALLSWARQKYADGEGVR